MGPTPKLFPKHPWREIRQERNDKFHQCACPYTNVPRDRAIDLLDR